MLTHFGTQIKASCSKCPPTIDRMSEFLIFGRFFLLEIPPFVSIFLPTKFNLNVPQRICLSAPLKEMEISYFSILHF